MYTCANTLGGDAPAEADALTGAGLPPAAAAPRAPAVTLRAPGRLHLGFLDPAATLGRAFGSIGLVIDGFETAVSVTAAARADEIVAATPAAQAEVERAARHLAALRRHSGCSGALRLQLLEVLPAHAGFGSGTQLALAIGRAFAHWHGLAVDTPTLARWLGRGLRSGVGIAGFDQGGLLVDGGPGADGRPAPLLARLSLPAAWRVLVAQDDTLAGLSGQREKQAIATLPPLPRALAADICHQVLMRVLPGAAADDFAGFAAGINRIQQVLGEHFAPAQGGCYTSAAVGRLMAWLAAQAPSGAAIGQSSWGPTGFAIVPGAAQADALMAAARQAGLLPAGLRLRSVAARDHGATLADTRAR
ncbi:beta-ribofuranosylaminobenzene 5'-phosphate synthase family protein [Aquincola sp. J276]|uniref:beta-ribofuranosylaminobenzene 5'-phosphate synthase family protein n=1 Tax=Aquincola sp. J276 TaxID=2898432 RepID=UPI0021519966|nr:beta-ribofuranosylaminobenzene 5'-phosphate synthase family protein [Aquincola sp. J276]MCR5868686.1 beta-ribofuranosylaminobenzene 5'-phosphate synthase [Aquincola sp. J276]